MTELRTLLSSIDPAADLASRHIWLIAFFSWLRGDESSADAALSRLQTFIVTVNAQPELHARLKAWWRTLRQTVEVTTLLADLGFAPRTAFVSELTSRLRRKLLPGTPETIDAAELFTMVCPSRFDALWLTAISETQMAELVELLAGDVALDQLAWQHDLMDSLTYCTAQIRATGFSPELRLRMTGANDEARAFHPLADDMSQLRRVFFDPEQADSALPADGVGFAAVLSR